MSVSFFCKRQVGDALILDPDEQVILENFFDEGVLEGGAGSVGGAEGGDGIVVEKQRCKILDFLDLGLALGAFWAVCRCEQDRDCLLYEPWSRSRERESSPRG